LQQVDGVLRSSIHRLRCQPGFTLIECAVVCAIVGVLATAALPSYLQYELRAARLDAVQALSRLQTEQESYRNQFGVYAQDLSALRGVTPLSTQGRYQLALLRSAPQTYHATAQAYGVQTQDHDCPALTLDVNVGFSNIGPNAACWRR
jgi:type IV pilus assembly protein PilE